MYDSDSMTKSEELRAVAGDNFGLTCCAHIISESTNGGTSGNQSKADYAAFAWAVLSRFGCQGIHKQLNGPNIHCLENVLTLHADVHNLFDKLKLFLEPMDTENQYKVDSYDPSYRHKYSKIVTPTTSDPTNLPLPSREYLVLHAACAKMAHLSGASEYIDKAFKDFDETFVLVEDGTSVAVLEHAIWASLQREPVSA